MTLPRRALADPFAVIRASTDAPNVGSTHVLEKLGFTLRRAPVGALDTLFYELRT